MNKNELIAALKLEDFSSIYKISDTIRREQKGDIVDIRAILEFSNYCKQDCAYCGLNCKNKTVSRYRMSKEEIIKTASETALAGYKTIVLQSGDDDFFTSSILGEIVKAIAKTGITITLSCGNKSYESLKYLHECGASRYLLKHETSNPELYEKFHHTSTFSQRITCLKDIKKAGFEVGSGFMVGLPGQTLFDIANDIHLLKTLECDMAGIGPFISHGATPLKGCANGSTELTKRAIALARIEIPSINLPATTALGVINKGEKNDVFSCGANVVMLKVTPTEFKKKYEIYPASFSKTDIKKQRQELEDEIKSLNRIPY
ncbi:MAG: [FeFe] hydrogenase H-cluster radical SAM maturase HydE [Oscillospiraceae bacterium]